MPDAQFISDSGLVLQCFIVSWTWVVVSVMLCDCILCIDLSIDVYVFDCVCKLSVE